MLFRALNKRKFSRVCSLIPTLLPGGEGLYPSPSGESAARGAKPARGEGQTLKKPLIFLFEVLRILLFFVLVLQASTSQAEEGLEIIIDLGVENTLPIAIVPFG